MGPRDWFETLRDAVERIGTTKDTGGSTTAGTVMAKENAILTKANSISTAVGRIGSAGDTGGSTTAGTLMGKLNATLSKANTISTATGRIGSSGDTAKTTLFGKLNSIIGVSGEGVKIVKSIQRVTFSGTPSADPRKLTISAVDAARCIVYFLDNYRDSNARGTLTYTLENSSLTVTYTCGAAYPRTAEFWIVELY